MTRLRIVADLHFLLFMFMGLLFFGPTVSRATSGYTQEQKAEMEKLFEVASLWQVGENRDKVATARQELIAYGEKAVLFLIEEKLDTLSTLNIRAIDAVILALPEISKQHLIENLANERRPDAMFNTVRLLGRLKAKEASSQLLASLQDGVLPSGIKVNDRVLRALISALGELDYAPAISEVAKKARAPDERTRIVALQSLSKFSSEKKIPFLIDALSDDVFTVRYVAAKALRDAFEQYPEFFWETLKKAWNVNSSGQRQIMDVQAESPLLGEIIKLMGDYGKFLVKVVNFATQKPGLSRHKALRLLDEVLEILELTAKNKDWKVRYLTVEALAKIGTAESRKILKRIAKTEADPLIVQLLKEAEVVPRHSFNISFSF